MGIYDNIKNAMGLGSEEEETPKKRKYPSLDDGKISDEERKKRDEAEKKRLADLSDEELLEEKKESDSMPKWGDVSRESPKKVDAETKSILSNIAKSTSPEEVRKKITEGTNYEDTMKKLDEELAKEEAAISKGLKEDRSNARIDSLIKTGIRAVAQMYAASKGLNVKIQGLPDESAARLREIKEEVDNNRRVLRSRIAAAKGLTKDLYSKEAAGDKARAAATASSKADQLKIDNYNAEVDRLLPEKQAQHKEEVAAKTLAFTKEWDKTKSKHRIDFLERMGASPEEAEEAAGKGWIRDNPLAKKVQAIIGRKVLELKGTGPTSKYKKDAEGAFILDNKEAPAKEEEKKFQIDSTIDQNATELRGDVTAAKAVWHKAKTPKEKLAAERVITKLRNAILNKSKNK